MLHQEYEKQQRETENAATAMETRAEWWKREAVEKAAKVAEASTTAKRFFTVFCYCKQPEIEDIYSRKEMKGRGTTII